MIIKNRVALSFAIAFLAASHATHASDLNVHYLDSKNGNYLFRGALPVTDTCPLAFQYSRLVSDLKTAAKGHGKFPDAFYLVDVSLLQMDGYCGQGCDTTERAMLQAELAYFQLNPTQGEFHFWEGDYPQIDATSTTITPAFQSLLVQTLDQWMPGNLAWRVEQLRTWLVNGIKGVKLPIVIYIHCNGGVDRTGEMAGAYSLRYLRLSWQEMNIRNLNGGDGPSNPNGQPSCDDHPFGCGNYYATHWYCFYLNAKYGMKLDCTTPWTTCPNVCNGPPSCSSGACSPLASCWPPCTPP